MSKKTVKAKRMFRTGFLNFARNGMVSVASVLVMSITLAVLTGILLFNHILTTTLTSVQNKVDVSVYFLPGAAEGEILSVQSKVAALPEVAETTYISERDALADFRTRHQNDQTTLQALDELDSNPIGAMLNIRAKEISQYESISNFFSDGSTLDTRTQSIIDHIDYHKNKDEINAIQGILKKGKFLGLLLTIILMSLSVIVTFNTIRLAIYFAREEISVMRLVGASNIQVQGPFIVEGALYGIVATLFTLVLFLPITYWLGKNMTDFFQGVNLFKYYLRNIHEFLAILLVFGAGLGALSSVMAARRYLRK
jgi:cell division transport system permease protein